MCKRTATCFGIAAMLTVILCPAPASLAQRNAQPDRVATTATGEVKISLEGFPLTLDLLKPWSERSLATYRAEGVARVEGSFLSVDLAPGFELPEGGLVIDASTRITPALAAALGLASTARLATGLYHGTVYFPTPTIPEPYLREMKVRNHTVYRPTPTFPTPEAANLRDRGREVTLNLGGKGGSGGWEVSVGISIKITK